MKKLGLVLALLTGLTVFAADKKISELTLLPAASFATGDLVPIVDVSSTLTKNTRIQDFDTRYVILPGTGLTGGNVTGTGTLNVDVGVTNGKIIQATTGDRLPVIDGSNLTFVNAVKLQLRDVSSSAPSGGQVLKWNSGTNVWEPASDSTGSGTVTSVVSGTGLTSGNITGAGTINVDVGTTNGKIVQVGASDRLPAIDASNLTFVNAVKIQTRDVSSTAPSNGQVLKWNNGTSVWEPAADDASGGGSTFSDSAFRVQDNGDATKQLAFEVSGVATATTRTVTIPDSNVDLSDVTNATSSSTAGSIVKRDGSSNFSAGTITASLSGNASTSSALAANPTDCASDTYATTIAANGNLTCASITNASTTATATNTNSTIVLRDGSGNFAAGTITADLTGNASTASALAANPTDCSANNYATTIAANGNLTCSQVSLTAGVTGALPIANGGTNSSAALNNNRVIVSSGSAIVEASAITGDRALVSNASGIPVASSVPTANLPKVVAAYITYSAGTPSVTQEKGGDWISSITDGGVGLPQLNLTGSFFTTAPICTCSSEENAASGQACMINSFSTSSIFVRTRDMASNLIDGNFHIICAEFF